MMLAEGILSFVCGRKRTVPCPGKIIVDDWNALALYEEVKFLLASLSRMEVEWTRNIWRSCNDTWIELELPM